MKLLLTGGAGYVGSACLRWLLDHGHDPIAYDDMSEGNVAAIPDASNRLIEGDIAETDRLADILRKHHVEAVMHFAALASVPDSIVDPEAYYRINVVGPRVYSTRCGLLTYAKSCSAARRQPTDSTSRCRYVKILPRSPRPPMGQQNSPPSG